jgi:uncharacterized membrane protein
MRLIKEIIIDLIVLLAVFIVSATAGAGLIMGVKLGLSFCQN